MRSPTYSPTRWNVPTGMASASPPGSRTATTLSSKCVPACPRSPEPVAVKNGTTNNDTQSNFLSRFTALILGHQGVVRAGAPRGAPRWEKLKWLLGGRSGYCPPLLPIFSSLPKWTTTLPPPAERSPIRQKKSTSAPPTLPSTFAKLSPMR